MSYASRLDLSTLTDQLCKDEKYWHQFPIIDPDFSAYIKARPEGWHTEDSHHFSLKLFQECRGYEFADENVHEEGVIVSSDVPSAPYQPDKTCSACWELKQGDSFPQTRITSECQHELDICLACLQEGLRGHIDRLDHRERKSLVCPSCFAVLSYEEVRKWSDTESFKK